MTHNKHQELTTKQAKGILLAMLAFLLLIGIGAAVRTTENLSNGERIGFVTKFSHKGRFYKSWEGELNLTQTGMNTSSLFEFSIDNDKEDPRVVATIDSAMNQGWKIKLTYHQVAVKNWFKNRGETNYFVTDAKVIDKSGFHLPNTDSRQGRVVDTIFVVIDKDELLRRKK